ncbi:unnamed protein product [Trichogramma brassicae]|uniref:Uncharacterized protein n=1 Tax=Trichogramma brassicae TaxID=86971 RepID=A0A6H5IF29_9HYME|nr:unnamed protein product [Trichogramma brassicae]
MGRTTTQHTTRRVALEIRSAALQTKQHHRMTPSEAGVQRRCAHRRTIVSRLTRERGKRSELHTRLRLRVIDYVRF